jgi:peptidoglycan/xylan/chitin deacetylase (PgdA/CDA1 family)
MSKRLLLARSMKQLGILRLLEMSRSRPGILILNHHRIGDSSLTRFDRRLFSATTEEFEDQLKYLKKHFEIIAGDELRDLVSRKSSLKHSYVSITFDDGYLDNFSHAFPILVANECQATFFVVPQYVGTSAIPWWDEIAYLVRNTTKTKISLKLPVPITLNVESDREEAIQTMLQHYKRPDNIYAAELMEDFRREAGCELPNVSRRFFDWAEAREMRDAGMAIGSHTQTHPILGQITPERQQWELEYSKQVIEQNLGSKINALAYPVGTPGGFDQNTEDLARSLGYEMCFSFYGGINTPRNLNPTNLLRSNTSSAPELFRTETMFLTKLGRLPH